MHLLHIWKFLQNIILCEVIWKLFEKTSGQDRIWVSYVVKCVTLEADSRERLGKMSLEGLPYPKGGRLVWPSIAVKKRM